MKRKMKVFVVTGSCGLVGSEAAKRLHGEGYNIIGIDNDMRATLFGPDASTSEVRNRLCKTLVRYSHKTIDIRDRPSIEALFAQHRSAIRGVIHTAAQPSHDWAARDPHTDFNINAIGTLNLLEATRLYCPEASFIFTSTNKVYGDTPNSLPLMEKTKRWEIALEHPYYKGVSEAMSVDKTKHSLFGASKLSADVLVQEYGRYFGMPTVSFRGGCLTGPAHAGAELHGFLAYLLKCTVTGKAYRVFGYKGKQVRDNIHSGDLVEAFIQFINAPRAGEVYNIGGSRHANCSVLEAIDMCENIAEKKLAWTYVEQNRIGDHMWYISDVSKFRSHFPKWDYEYDLPRTLVEMHQHLVRK